MRRLAVVVAIVASLALAGCAQPGGGPDDGDDGAETIYTHDWFYGPGYSPDGGYPVFEDSFAVDEGPDLQVEVDWSIEAGLAAVNLTTPSGDQVNVTAPKAGAQGASNTSLEAKAGMWGVEIPTWPGDGGAFPEGQVTVRVVQGGSR